MANKVGLLLFLIAAQEAERNISATQSDPPPPPQFVTTNINAIKINYKYEDDTTSSYIFYGKQDRPEIADAASDPVPIQADVYYASDYLKANSIGSVGIVGSTTIQPPSIKSVNKSDTTSQMIVDLDNPSSVVVYFGFKDRGGIAEYTIYDKSNNSLSFSGTVDLHSSTDSQAPFVRGVELTDKLDERKSYQLRIKHTGSANPTIFDSLFDHPIYVGDVIVNRVARTNRSVVEYISNNAFANESYPDDGTRNSITGRDNFVEFFNVQQEVLSEPKNRFRIKSAAVRVRSVELNNGRKFVPLDRNIDWTVEYTNPDTYEADVVLSFQAKKNSAIRIVYDVASYALQRKIELSQPRTYSGAYDRYTDIYVQNEAVYIEINANEQ